MTSHRIVSVFGLFIVTASLNKCYSAMAQSRRRTSDILYTIYIALRHLLSYTNRGPSSIHFDAKEASSNHPLPVPSDLCERRTIVLTRSRCISQTLRLLCPLVCSRCNVCRCGSLGEFVDRWDTIRACERRRGWDHGRRAEMQ
jgi:hypothetical protein